MVDSFQPTFPPVSWYHRSENEPKVIRPSWFLPLSGIHGRSTIFELRNLVKSNPDIPDDDADTSDSGHDTAESSDEELNQAKVASIAETSQARTPSSPQAAVKLERKEEIRTKSISYRRSRETNHTSTIESSERAYWGCSHDKMIRTMKDLFRSRKSQTVKATTTLPHSNMSQQLRSLAHTHGIHPRSAR